MLHRKCDSCSAEDEKLSRAPVPGGVPARAEAPASVGRVLAGAGQKLPVATQRAMERRFGFDFGAIRVHTDASAARSAQAVSARAYTVGRNIVFNTGEFRPGSRDSDALLAHELVHTIQQGASARLPESGPPRGDTAAPAAAGATLSRLSAETLRRKNMFDCRAMGVPCPPAIGFPEICALIDCIPAATANLPFAVSPGVCIYQCDSGKVCACVLVGSKESAVCTFRFCSSGRNMASAEDANAFAREAVAAAGSQLQAPKGQGGGGADAAPAAAAPGGAAPTMQAKLIVGAPNDRFEQEADRVAAQVMRLRDAGAQSASGCGAPGCVHRNLTPWTLARTAAHVQRLSYSPLFDFDEPTATPPQGTGSPAGSPAASGPEQPGGDGQQPTLQRAPLPAWRSGGSPGLDAEQPNGIPMGPRDTDSGSTLDYRRATELLDCIRIMGEANADECRHQILGTQRPLPPLCVPATDPNWSDFQGPVPARTTFAAETDFHFEVGATDWGFSVIRAIFDSAKSWVKPSTAAGNRQHLVTACQAAVAQGQTFNLTPGRGCAASPAPNSSIVASTAAECETKIGAELDRVAAAESQRLLTHERYHFKLACVMAGKGSAVLKSGKSKNADQIRGIVSSKAGALTTQYDAQTQHGCNPAAQARWQTDIDGGLQNTTVP